MPFAQPISVSDSEYQAQEELLFRTAARLRGLLFYRAFVLAALPLVAWLYRDAIASPLWFWTAFGLLIGTQLVRIVSDYIGGNLAKNAAFNIFVDALGYTLLAASSEGLDSPFVYFFVLLSLYSVVWFDRRVSMAVGGVIAVCLTTLYALHGLPMVGSTATFASMLLVLVGLAIGTGEIARLVAEARERMVRAAMELIQANKRILAQQQALRASEERVRLVLDTAEEGIFGMDLDGSCIFANRSCLNMLGYKSEQHVIGKDMHLLIHHTRPDGRVYRKDDCLILSAGRKGERAHSVEEMHWRADGTGFPVEYWSHPIVSEGQPVGIVVTFIDITERKRAESSLRRAQFMVENTPQEVWLADVQGRLIYANLAAAASLGYDQADLAGLSVADVDPVGGAAFAAQVAMLKAGPQPAFEATHVSKDGRRIPKEIRASHISLDGKDYICGFAQDISERKQNEAELQARMERISRQQKAAADLARLPAVVEGDMPAVVRSITEVAAGVMAAERASVWLFNETGTELLCQDLFLATSRTHEAGGRLTEQLYGAEFQALKAARYVDAHDALSDPRTAGYAEGYLKPLGISSMLDAGIQTGGKHYGVVCIEHTGAGRHWEPDEIAFVCQAADQLALTIQNKARRQAEEAMRQLNQELESRVAQRTQELADSFDRLKEAFATIERAQDELVRSEKLASLGSLVAGVAHELNTPLGNSLTVATTLAERAQAIQKELGTGALRRSTLHEFIQGTAHASDLLTRNLFRASDLITHFKQVAVDQTSAQRRPFDLAETVAEVVLTLQPQFKKTPHRIELAIPSGIQLDSYPGPLGQVITNLVSNALVHGFDAGAHGLVRIGASADAEEVLLTVADNGRGIAPEHQAKVFDPFFTTRLGQGGSGLGLHIVYSIVTRVLGGRITLASQPGEGTTLTLHLPLQAPAQDRPAASAGMAIPSS
jgi:PAS domain S-box-containing protein